jgi:hypothetical protein
MAAEKRLAYQTDSGTQVFAELKGDRLLFRSIGPANSIVGYDIDVNGDGRIDPSVDVSFGMQQDGSLCAAKWVSERETSFCGQAKTAARSSQETIGDQVLRRIDVPFSEVSRNGRDVRLRLSMYREGKGNSYAWIKYEPATATVASLSSPSSGSPSAATVTAPPRSHGAPATASTQAKGPSDRQLAERTVATDEYNGKSCSFPHLPGVTLKKHIRDGVLVQLHVLSAESGQLLGNDLTVTVKQDGTASGRIMVTHAAHRGTRARRAELLVGDRRFELRPIHPIDRVGPPMTFKRYVGIDSVPREALAAMALSGAPTARLVLHGDAGEISRWSFPIGSMGYMERAMELTQWTCASAW